VEPGEMVGIQLKEFFEEKKYIKINASDPVKKNIICIYRPELDVITLIRFRLKNNSIISFLPENFLHREIQKIKYKREFSLKTIKAILTNAIRLYAIIFLSKCVITPDKTIKKNNYITDVWHIDFSFTRKRCLKMIAMSSEFGLSQKLGYILGFTNEQNIAGLRELRGLLGKEVDLVIAGGGKNADQVEEVVVSFDKISEFYRVVCALVVCLPYSSGVITKVAESIFNKRPVFLSGKIPLLFEIDGYGSIVQINKNVTNEKLLQDICDARKSIDADIDKLISFYDMQWSELNRVLEMMMKKGGVCEKKR
jgi:hypothetical protein